MKIEYANTIPMRKILFKIDFTPLSETSTHLTYASPFCSEGKAMLVVDIEANTWLCNASMSGGGPINFVSKYLEVKGEASTDADALRWIKNMMRRPPRINLKPFPDHTLQDSNFEVRNVLPLGNHHLIEYLTSRGISRNIAKDYIREVRIVNKETKKLSRAIGLRNDDGGYAIRNPVRKVHIGPPMVTFVRGTKSNPASINIFKDSFDFLSTLSQRRGMPFKNDTIILNSYRCINDAIPLIRNHQYGAVYTWLDNNAHGMRMTKQLAYLLKAEGGAALYPMNNLYKGFKDINEWHVDYRRKHQNNIA